MNRFKLIAEIRKRPELWDTQSEFHKSTKTIQAAWKDVAVAMGSDVTANDCSRTWKSLRCTNRDVAKKIELRIAKDKLNGTYDPKKNYKCQWVFYKHMKFINDIQKSSPMELNGKKSEDNDNNTKMDETNSLDEQEMSNAMDRFKLIAEIRKRPSLWEEHRSRKAASAAWKEVAVAMGSNVNDCSRSWRSLRGTNREVVKKIELRIQEAKLNGSYNPNNDYSSQWPYLKHMEFINGMKLGNSAENDNTKMELCLEMSKVMDKFKLIDEVRKRPALWDIKSDEHISCLSVLEVWKDLAVSVGSDVKKCQRTWMILCKIYRRLVKRIESRIKEDKLNGSYDPNNDYSSKWIYFEPMVFLKNIQTGPIKVRTSGEKLKLIAEVRKRPELWFFKSKEYTHRLTLQKSWEDLARVMGADVEDCKRKWACLLAGYRGEARKLELRIKEDKLKGSYNPNNEYRSKWIYYEHMKFYYDIKNPSLMELGNTSVNDNTSDDNDSNQVSEFQYMNNNKMEPELDLEPENQDLADDKPTTSNWKCTKRSYDQANYLEDLEKEEHILIMSTKVELEHDLDPEVYIPDDEDYDTDSQLYDIVFLSEQNSSSNQESADDKPSSTGVLSPKVEPELDLDPEVYIPDDEDYDTDSQMSGMEFLSEPNSPQNQKSADDIPSSTGGNCTKQSCDQAILLEDIEKEEHNVKVELGHDLNPEVYIPDDEDYDTDSQMPGIEFLSKPNSLKNQILLKTTDSQLYDIEFLSEPNSPQTQESADDIPSSTGGNCTKRSYDQANLLEDLEKDEHNLIKLVHSNEMVPVDDSDYNFLVSFLPKMKKINELQNLQFRAKIINLMMDIAKE